VDELLGRAEGSLPREVGDDNLPEGGDVVPRRSVKR